MNFGDAVKFVLQTEARYFRALFTAKEVYAGGIKKNGGIKDPALWNTGEAVPFREAEEELRTAEDETLRTVTGSAEGWRLSRGVPTRAQLKAWAEERRRGLSAPGQPRQLFLFTAAEAR